MPYNSYKKFLSGYVKKPRTTSFRHNLRAISESSILVNLNNEQIETNGGNHQQEINKKDESDEMMFCIDENQEVLKLFSLKCIHLIIKI